MNALKPLTADALVAAFVGVLPVASVDGPVEFEHIGDEDYLGEGAMQRGLGRTSLDAAFRYRTPDGRAELALVEWKYVEKYSGARVSGRLDTIRSRYQARYDAQDGPFLPDVLPFDDVLVEPLYQLVRQQLLAHAMEQDLCLGLDAVRVVHVAPAGNLAYARSLRRAPYDALGATVYEVFRALLRDQSRFRELDSVVFTRPEVDTSGAYAVRYGHR